MSDYNLTDYSAEDESRLLDILVKGGVSNQDAGWILCIGRELLRLKRMFALVNAEGSEVRPSLLNRGKVVVVDGRTGLDGIGATAEEAILQLLEEADGAGSPPRLFFGLVDGVPHMQMYPPVPPEEIRAAIEKAVPA